MTSASLGTTNLKRSGASSVSRLISENLTIALWRESVFKFNFVSNLNGEPSVGFYPDLKFLLDLRIREVFFGGQFNVVYTFWVREFVGDKDHIIHCFKIVK